MKATHQQRRSFEDLYRRHHDEIRRYLERRVGDHDEADDVAQTAFLDAFRAYVRNGTPENPRPWLYAIAENTRRRRYKRWAGRPREVALYEDTAEAPEPFDTTELHEALTALPFRQRAALLLREVGGLSYSELAHALNITEPAVQMLLFRARRAMRANLRERGAAVVVFPWLPRWLSALNGARGGLVGVAEGVGALTAVAVLGLTVPGSSAQPGIDRARGAPAVVYPAPPADPPTVRRSRASVSSGVQLRVGSHGVAADPGEPPAGDPGVPAADGGDVPAGPSVATAPSPAPPRQDPPGGAVGPALGIPLEAPAAVTSAVPKVDVPPLPATVPQPQVNVPALPATPAVSVPQVPTAPPLGR